jgi:hypothetical protein
MKIHWHSLSMSTFSSVLARSPTHPPSGGSAKLSKLTRQLADIRICVHSIASGDKNEIRKSYIPVLLPHLVWPLDETEAVSVGRSPFSSWC